MKCSVNQFFCYQKCSKSPKFMSLEPGDEFGFNAVVSGSTARVILLACKILYKTKSVISHLNSL